MYQTDQECPICGVGTLKRHVITEKFEYKGAHLDVDNYVVFRCATCEEGLVDPKTIKSSEKLIRDFHRRVDGFLTSDQIKKRRVALGFTQEGIAALLGVGAKNFARYESGKVTQSKSMDNLLRIIFEYPFTLDVISDNRVTVDLDAVVHYSTKPSDHGVRYDYSALRDVVRA